MQEWNVSMQTNGDCLDPLQPIYFGNNQTNPTYLCVGEQEGPTGVLGVALTRHKLHRDVFIGLLVVGPVLVAALLAAAQLLRQRQKNTDVHLMMPIWTLLA